MPRKWTNHGSGGYGTHCLPPPTPVHTPVSLQLVDEILDSNAKAAKQEEKHGKRRLHSERRLQLIAKTPEALSLPGFLRS